MDIRLEPRTAAYPKREEIERLHETMKKGNSAENGADYGAVSASTWWCRYW